jgi:hypothetical protein
MPLKKYNRKGGPSINGITPGGKKDRNKKRLKPLTGENTSITKKDNKGIDYALILNTDKNFIEGDTIRLGKAPRDFDNNLMGGDYKVKENKYSKKRATDEPRSFTIKK